MKLKEVIEGLVVILALLAPLVLGCGAANPTSGPAPIPHAERDDIDAQCIPSPTGKGGEMCAIPAGEFMMGCNAEVDSECLPHELPFHRVELDLYYIDRTEVTVAEYRKCFDAGACGVPVWKWGEQFCNWGRESRDDHPQNCSQWFHARQYCEWVGKRLPSEAEWEKAARGTDGRKYPWGNEPAVGCGVAVIDDGEDGCGENHTFPVCSKPDGIGPYGLCDMIGNTYEWTADWYAADYYERSPAHDPQGPASGELRVLKGGSWNRESDRARASHRVGYPADTNPYCRGFRCVWSPEG